jgi:diguanylate cyclase (GGDEF)-like protein/PAS domain S-box-containing protein
MRRQDAQLRAIQAEHERTKKTLRDTLSRQEAILDNIPDMVWLKDLDSRFLVVNEAFVKASGITKVELIGKTDFDFWPLDLAERYRNDDVEVMRFGKRKKIEETLFQSKAEDIWIETIKSPVYDEQGEVVGITGIARNVTDRKRAFDELATSEAKYRELVQSAKSIILRFDTSGRITFFNEFAQSFFGYTQQEILGRDLLRTIVPLIESSGRDLVAMIKDLLANPDKYPTNENENVRKNGERVWMSWTNRALYNEQGQLTEILSVGNDITRLKRTEAKLVELATTDPLTGLFNRRHFWEVCKREIERIKRYGSMLSLLMIDVDHFKLVNDTYGHDVGDQVLQSLADLCRRTFRGVDIIGRIGGEEFAVLLPETGLPEAAGAAHRLRQAVEQASIAVGEHFIKITVSAGVAMAVNESADLETLFKQADLALYAAKAGGRNRVETMQPRDL